MEDEDGAEHDQADLGEEVEHREADVELRRLAEAADVDQDEKGDDGDAADHVPGEWLSSGKKAPR